MVTCMCTRERAPCICACVPESVHQSRDACDLIHMIICMDQSGLACDLCQHAPFTIVHPVLPKTDVEVAVGS